MSNTNKGVSIKKFILTIPFFLSGCMTYDCYTTEFNFDECMETAYTAAINAQSLPEKNRNAFMIPLLQKYLDCKKQQKEWKDVCPYTIFLN
jgi:hypothetical protein